MSNKIRLSELKNVIEQPSQAHGISEVTSGPLKIDQPSQAHRMKDIYFGSQKRAGREAKPKKDKFSKSGTESQQTIAKFKPPDLTVTTRTEKSSGLRKTDDQPRQAHDVLLKTSESPTSAGREANSKKDVSSENDTNPQQTVAKLKTSDPNVFTMRKNNSFFKNLITAFRTRLVSTNPSLRSK